MKTFEIYIEDLIPKKQKELYKFLGDSIRKYDISPITNICIVGEDEEDKEE